MAHNFLPINKKEMKERGWKQVDFVYVSGDAYVDHPSFGAAIITRLLESKGYKIGVLAQPDWKKEDAIKEFGRPRLGFMVSGGNMDSMVNHYTVAKKHRKIDAYTPGGVMGKRPDRAVTVYGNLIRRVFPDVPIIIGGIEASLRRLAHYDYWSDSLKKSILLDSQADILSYGMGERSIVDIADALNSGIAVSDLNYIPGTVYKEYKTDYLEDAVCLPDYQELEADKRKYAESFYTQYCNTDPFSAKRLVEAYGRKLYVVQNPPAKPLTQEEMDEVYALPYERTYHPSYEKAGGVSAIQEVKFSLVSNRGCFGGCSFCALTFHQGRIVQTRSHDSIIEEAEKIIKEPEFKGYIHDVGGPTANFRHPSCEKQLRQGVCKNRQCLFPKPCKNLMVDHKDYIKLLRKLRNLPKVKKVFIRSGIRFDYVMADSSDDFIKELCQYHVSGQLKVAPEHITDHVLDKMGKPEVSVYKAFVKKYRETNEKLGLKQYLVPYLISSHPGSTLEDAIALAEAVRDMGYMPEQVQDFYPTPSTISACMYYTGLDPRTMKEVYVVRNPHEKALQRALIQYRNPKMYDLVKEALLKADRSDLIGFEKKCLIRPRQSREERDSWANGKSKGKGRGKSQKKKKAIRNVHKKK
ncbi:MAG: YgiQ family radical SAM protein [Anaerostipes sp.]|nr:YgiQ family radical SAM protein [Anaerostipes sp.]